MCLKNLYSCSLLFVLVTCFCDAQAAIVLARSADDWDNAALDGIRDGGGATTPGSPDDAAQQGHSDTEGSGSWRYNMTSLIVGGSSSGAPVEPVWMNTISQGVGYYDGPTRKFSRTAMAPNASASGRGTVNRQWTGANLMGETLRIFGSFSTEANTAAPSASNNGVRVGVAVNGEVKFEQQILPGTQVEFDFLVENLATAAPIVRFGVGPDGPFPGATTFDDFFNDSTQFQGEIHLVPLPAPVILLLSAIIAMPGRWRRSVIS